MVALVPLEISNSSSDSLCSQCGLIFQRGFCSPCLFPLSLSPPASLRVFPLRCSQGSPSLAESPSVFLHYFYSLVFVQAGVQEQRASPVFWLSLTGSLSGIPENLCSRLWPLSFPLLLLDVPCWPSICSSVPSRVDLPCFAVLPPIILAFVFQRIEEINLGRVSVMAAVPQPQPAPRGGSEGWSLFRIPIGSSLWAPGQVPGGKPCTRL